MRWMLAFATATFLAIGCASADAKDIGYRKYVTLKVGQSAVLKGVRSGCEEKVAPTWNRIRSRLPKSRTGAFSDGGAGTVRSKSCKGRVPARAVRFTAKTPGTETLVIYNDGVRVTVK